MQDAVLRGRVDREAVRRRSRAAGVIQRAYLKYAMRKRHHAMIHIVREVWHRLRFE